MDDKVYTPGPDGSKIEIPPYVPPMQGIYAHYGQDGTVTIVNSNGKPVSCPPYFAKSLSPEEQTVYAWIPGSAGETTKVEIPPYKPSST